MKIKFIAAVVTLLSAFSSCQKCETCVPYQTNGGPINAFHIAQTVKVCSKVEIEAYETGKNFTTAQGDSVYFVCH
jgi:hypothetical protein